MAPAGSDERTTELADPINSDDAEASAAEATPFGDWREQLRERVKEIRARKHAAHREDIDELSFEATAAAATAEKLEAARAEAAVPATEDEHQVQLVDRARDERRADIAGIVDDLVGPPATQEIADESLDAVDMAGDALAPDPVDETPEVPAMLEPPTIEPAATTPDTVSAAEEVPLLTEPGEVAETMPEPEPAFFAPADADETGPVEEELSVADPDVPLFQDEPTVFADTPAVELDGEIDGDINPADRMVSTEPEPEPELLEPEPELLDNSAPEPDPLEAAAAAAVTFDSDIETGAQNESDEEQERVPSWARSEASEFAPPPIAIEKDGDAADSARDAIPPELRDVEIPAWALPREPSRESNPSPTAGRSPEADFIEAAALDAIESLDNESTASEASPEVAAATTERTLRTERGADDVHIVGEFTTPTTEKRTDLPPAETAVPQAEMLSKSIGDLSALADTDEVEIAPPGSLVDATDLGIDLHADPGDRALPGLFDREPEAEKIDDEGTEALAEAALAHIRNASPDTAAALDEIELRSEDAAPPDLDALSADLPADEPAPAEFRSQAGAEPVEPAPDVEVVEQVVEPEAPSDPLLPDADLATDSPGTESSSLEWDENDLDAELVADAARQHADASAPLSDRVYSALADGLVVLTMGIVLMIAGASAAGTAVVPFVQAAPLPFLLAWSLFGLVYGVIFVGTSGQTLGKMAMRVRVIGADTFHVGYGRAALRAVAYAAAALPVGLGLLSAVRDPEHRGLHDRLSSTRVVKA